MRLIPKALSTVLAVLTVATGAVAQTTVPFSGSISGTHGLPAVDGDYAMTLTVWSDPDGGELLWEEHRPRVPVRSGAFIVHLELEGLPSRPLSEQFLEITVAGDVLGPRTSLASVQQAELEVDGNLRADELWLANGWIPDAFTRIASFLDELQVQNWDGKIGLYVEDLEDRGNPKLAIEARAGGLVHLPGGSDAKTDGGSGYLVIGSEVSTNLVFDDNEIMARDNGATAGLYLQHDGGNVYINGNLVQTSDLRRKREIQSLDRGLDELMRLRPVSFVWPERPSERRLGLIAQEVEGVVEEVVYEDDNGMLGIAYQSLVPLLIRAIQTQQAEIEELREDLEDLTTQLR